MKNADATAQGGRLVVLLHGFKCTPESFKDVVDLAEDVFPDAKIHAPPLPHSRTFSKVRAAAIVAEQIRAVTQLWETHHFDDIVLVGHSMGAVMARRILIEASSLPKTWPRSAEGEANEAATLSRVEPELGDIAPQQWASKVSRLVLIAGMGRGWSIDNAKSGIEQLIWLAGSVVGHAMPGTKPTIFDIRKGAPFIVQTRLRWLELLRHDARHGVKPEVIQLLGTVDEMVSPNDSVDYADDLEGEHIRLVEVPETGHAHIIRLTPGKGSLQTPAICERRREILRAALTGDKDVLDRHTIPRAYMDDELPPPPNTEIKDVVFVIHGIRDTGYWTKKIAARVKAEAANRGEEYVSRTPSYGYFPILPFLLPWYRRQKVEWLMDQYVEARATYPKANFHYMGHSNGTYLGARALLDYPAISFRRIMFAGSVVRPDYPWRLLVHGGRVDKIYNAVATRDVVVALFPNGLRWLKRIFDLGGAGHRGFASGGLRDALFQLEYSSGTGSMQKFVEGAHSAARQESQWDEIAEFIVNGANPLPDNQDFADAQPWWSRLLGAAAPFAVLGIAGLVIGLFLFLLVPLLMALVPDALATFVASLRLDALWAGLLPNPSQVVSKLWSDWIAQGTIVHLFWMTAYIVTLRFVALKF